MRIISGEYKGRKLKVPSKMEKGFRPATYKVRQAIFSMLISQGMEFEGCRAIDLFAGTGSLGFECLSRGAEQVWFVENDRNAILYLRKNLELFQVDEKRYSVISKDVNEVLKRTPPYMFHLCFIDPPYRRGSVIPCLKKIVQNRWVIPNGFIVAEVEGEFVFNKEVDGLELLINRNYGQTRVLIWTVITQK